MTSRTWLLLVPLLLVPLLPASVARAQEISMVPVTVDGETVRLAMRIYRPPTAERAPTLVYNHGSTGNGRDPSLFVRPIDQPALAHFFVQRGWAVVMPARRGHVHLFPRLKNDPFVGGPIDTRKAAFTRTPAELERMKQALRALAHYQTLGSGQPLAGQC